MARCIAGLCLILLPLQAAWCLVVRGDRPPEQALADPGDTPEVVALLDGRAAGTLIAPEWILTAAHVGEAFSGNDADAMVSIGTDRARIEQVILHPDWDAERVGQANVTDLALLRLGSPICSVTPATLYRADREAGQTVQLYGWGRTGDGIDPGLMADGRFRRGENLIDEATHRLRFDFDPPESGEALDLEAVSGPGDSGGPGFLLAPQGRQLAGVSSYQEDVTAPGIYGVVENYERVSLHQDWVDTITAGSSDCGTRASP